MAAISLSPPPIRLPVMSTSTRRTPLSSNPNVANSPLRGASAQAQAQAHLRAQSKLKRSHANVQREELYGQPPPLKKQLLDHPAQKPPPSPTRSLKTANNINTHTTLPSRVARPAARDRNAQQTPAPQQDANIERIRQWKNEYHARFPKMVFYFESVSEDLRAKLSKHATSLGAREERFFSNNITHVVTTRSIPSEQDEDRNQLHEEPEVEEQPQTINPSLLDRTRDSRDARRRLFDTATTSRRGQLQPQDDNVRRTKPPVRNIDVLCKARDMGKKIWPLEKFQRMLDILLEPDAATASHGCKADSARHGHGGRKGGDEPKLSQLLQHERLNGPSDRDHTVANRELIPFKGPYLFIYDIDEKQKPIMVREYPKVSQKYEGEWPQFRTVTEGRCPFIEEVSHADRASRKAKAHEKDKEEERERERERERASKSKHMVDARPSLQPPPPKLPAAGPVTRKRTLTEMEDFMQNAAQGPTKASGAEPLASGVQPSNVTSAIRSQMISSATGIGAAKAGTSKEVHGLQRKVLQRGASHSQDRRAELSLEVASSRSTGTGPARATSRRLELIDEDANKTASGAGQAQTSSKMQSATAHKKRDLKPGYCENCQDKFKDFSEHILTRKHRKFAENDSNWIELDELLAQIKRVPKYSNGGMHNELWE